MSPDGAQNPPGAAQVIPGSLADLVERPLYAHLATVRPDGTPQVNPTWFRFDGTYLWLAERYGMPQGPPEDAAERIAVAIRPQHTTTY